MVDLRLPWLTAATLLPLAGAFIVSRMTAAEIARRWSLAIFAATLACAVGAWIDFVSLGAPAAHDRWNVLSGWLGAEVFVVDELSVPLLALASLLYLLTSVATLGSKVRRFYFVANLVSL
jgi:NADH-quinone oxidoreductase subunit M